MCGGQEGHCTCPEYAYLSVLSLQGQLAATDIERWIESCVDL
jgi:hypothetical protein